jgi:hypothetical protein
MSLIIEGTTEKAGKPHFRGRISAVNLLIKIGCFVEKEKYSFGLKSS